MKRLLLVVALVLFPLAAQAQIDSRDVLLTQNGTLYTIESQDRVDTEGTRLTLIVDNGSSKSQTIIPESVAGGATNFNPALAYDADSDTLFVFWIRMPNAMSSELLLARYHNGQWQKAVSIDNRAFTLRYNLGISVQRKVQQPQPDGTIVDVPALIVHAVWWEQTGAGEQARYALVASDKSDLSTVEVHDLAEFAPDNHDLNIVDPTFNADILKHPAIIDNGTRDSIDVLYGDLKTNTFNRVTLKPIAQIRIHIPIGHSDGGRIPAPNSFTGAWSGRVSAIGSGNDSRLLLYNTTDTAVRYIVFDKGTWSPVRTLPASDKLTPDAAVGLLSRMMTQ